jgi:predicted  nucleic acid-binding Zn-ribbon protein
MASTTAERLTRIETLLEAMMETRTEERKAMQDKLDAMASDIKDIKTEVEADKAELKALKNKGAGILIGVGLAGGAIGATVSGFIQSLGGLFK